MSNRSVQLNIAVPEEILEAYKSCQSLKNLTAFARIAIIQKLNRDFGFSLDEQLGDFSRGKRNDLKDPERKKKCMAALQRNAAAARKRHKSKSSPQL